MSFTIHRGTNVFEFAENFYYPARLDASGAQQIKAMGFDHVRLPVSEENLYTRAGKANLTAFDDLEATICACSQTGLRVIVDLHTLYSHMFTDERTPRLFTDPAEEARFAFIWRSLSARLRHHPLDMVAYELMNEAIAADPADWNRVAQAGYEAIRELEPERVIVLGSNYFNQTHTFHDLWVPDDRNMILTFHYYRPMLVTHYRAVWWQGGFYAGPNHYPGAPITEKDLAAINSEFLKKVPQWSTESYDCSKMVRDFQEPLGVAKRHNLPLYCGEFGCIAYTPQPLRRAWYADFMKALNDNGIAWGNWDFRGWMFGVLNHDGSDTGILDVLMR